MAEQPNVNDAQAIQIIQTTIRQAGEDLRRRYPLLEHQDAIGLGIFCSAVAATLLAAWAYLSGAISAWVCIPVVAIATSLLHELEHDLIHWQYFKKNKPIHHFMLLVGWILRPGTINPWVRRKLHFLHHKTSGTEADMEERGIGNGQPYGLLRFWTMADTLGANLYRAARQAPKGKRLKSMGRILMANFPFSVLTLLITYGYLGFHLIDGAGKLMGAPVEWSFSTLGWESRVSDWMVVLIAPFYLRSFCLNFISSNMHYYGNVHSLIQQTQVLNAWYFMPFQLFCFNFGSTHGIHHFVVGEPFYIRQLTAAKAHAVMRAQGVSFNDLRTFSRANRYAPTAAAPYRVMGT